MTSYVALLRAVNVGTNQIKMDRLRAAFVRVGIDDVTTHIQSGNVLFTSMLGAVAARDHVQAVLQDEFGKSIIAIMRTAKQLAAVCAANPFLSTAPAADPDELKRLYVNFLSAKPSTADIRTFNVAVDKTPDQVQIIGTHAYVRYANGVGTSKLTTSVWNRLGVDSTARNWNVTSKLAELAAAR